MQEPKISEIKQKGVGNLDRKRDAK